MSGKPVRVQLRRTKGWRMPPNTVKVDRSTMWGNPFVVAKEVRGPLNIRTAADAVENFRIAANNIVEQYPEYFADLRGKNLACWCAPDAPCHADVLLEIANRKETAG